LILNLQFLFHFKYLNTFNEVIKIFADIHLKKTYKFHFDATLHQLTIKIVSFLIFEQYISEKLSIHSFQIDSIQEFFNSYSNSLCHMFQNFLLKKDSQGNVKNIFESYKNTLEKIFIEIADIQSLYIFDEISKIFKTIESKFESPFLQNSFKFEN
jgi:hypothetical protein